MRIKATAADRRLFLIWYYDGEGQNTCELAMLEESEVTYAQKMFTQMYGDEAEVVVAPAQHVETLTELVKANGYDPGDYE